MAMVDIDLGNNQPGWHDKEDEYVFKPRKGLSEEIICEILAMKGEPEWMLTFRLKAFQRFFHEPIPAWGGGALEDIDFDNIYYSLEPTESEAKVWDMDPGGLEFVASRFDEAAGGLARTYSRDNPFQATCGQVRSW